MWSPIKLVELEKVIREDEAGMQPGARSLWEQIRILPEKWQLHPLGDQGGGFWVVGIIGKQVIWYSDIEHAFNISQYTKYGEIGIDGGEIGELNYVVHHL